MVNCEASLPSGVHDNVVIQSESHLIPFAIQEETIVGSDGSLSTDKAHSHFLDGRVCVLMSVLYHQKGFHRTKLGKTFALFWLSNQLSSNRVRVCVCVVHSPLMHKYLFVLFNAKGLIQCWRGTVMCHHLSAMITDQRRDASCFWESARVRRWLLNL